MYVVTVVASLALVAGFAVPASATAGIVVGRATKLVDNLTGIDGALQVAIDEGTYYFAADVPATQANVGKLAYAADDQTVTMTAGATLAGVVRAFDANGIWVECGLTSSHLS